MVLKGVLQSLCPLAISPDCHRPLPLMSGIPDQVPCLSETHAWETQVSILRAGPYFTYPVPSPNTVLKMECDSHQNSGLARYPGLVEEPATVLGLRQAVSPLLGQSRPCVPGWPVRVTCRRLSYPKGAWQLPF